MSDAIVPVPRCELNIRPATMADYPFIDRLQAMQGKALGFMPKAQLQGKIAAGHVLIAEELGGRVSAPAGVDVAHTAAGDGRPAGAVGYCMSQDRYFKRDDVGIIYQLNVLPGKQRSLVGASLIKAVFDRAAYGCRLFCCWCAQDLEANYFWESLGFVPLAFRTGANGRKAPRTHIFWQRRIREGDTGPGATPYWFPAKTDGGMMREARLVLPIPPGAHWRDAMPTVLPGVGERERALGDGSQGEADVGKRLRGPKRAGKLGKGHAGPLAPTDVQRRIQFGPPSAKIVAPMVVETSKPTPVKKPARPKVKCDPALVAAARELRDRWLEQINATPMVGRGKYEVSRAIDGARSGNVALPMPAKRLLSAA